MADYLTITMLHLLVTKSTAALKHVLEQHLEYLPSIDALTESTDFNATLERTREPDAPKAPLFNVVMVLESAALRLDPSAQITIDITKQLFELWHDATVALKSFIGDKFYHTFTK